MLLFFGHALICQQPQGLRQMAIWHTRQMSLLIKLGTAAKIPAKDRLLMGDASPMPEGARNAPLLAVSAHNMKDQSGLPERVTDVPGAALQRI
jgi:hypothetical protein